MNGELGESEEVERVGELGADEVVDGVDGRE